MLGTHSIHGAQVPPFLLLATPGNPLYSSVSYEVVGVGKEHHTAWQHSRWTGEQWFDSQQGYH